MKTIQNKETAIKMNETSNVKYSDLLVIVMDKPTKEGIPLSDMRRDLKILDALDKAKDGSDIELEDSDAAHVKEQVKKSVWALRHKDILTFADDIDAL